MNKTMKSVVAFAMVSALAGTALFAAPKPNGKHHSRPAVEGEVKGPEAEFQTLIGKVKVNKAGFVTLTTDEDNRYVLTVPENIEKLAKAAGKGVEEVCSYLEQTQYKEAASSLNVSISAFEKWCDDFQIKSLKPQKWEPFTIGPLVAYILARQNEIKAVRMILSAKQNDLDIQMIKERLREMYV